MNMRKQMPNTTKIPMVMSGEIRMPEAEGRDDGRSDGLDGGRDGGRDEGGLVLPPVPPESFGGEGGLP